MPSTEYPVEEPVDPRFERILARSRHAVGASDRMPVRVIFLFIIIGICMTLSPTPANIVGIGATLLLSLDTATHRR